MYLCVVKCQRLSQRVVDYLLAPSMVVVRKIEVQYLKIVFLVIKKCDYLSSSILYSIKLSPP